MDGQLTKMGFDSLTDEELIGLRVVFRRAFNRQVASGTASGTKVAAACLNEVDARLARRGVLDPSTGRSSK